MVGRDFFYWDSRKHRADVEYMTTTVSDMRDISLYVNPNDR